jgi:competence protein ComEC
LQIMPAIPSDAADATPPGLRRIAWRLTAAARWLARQAAEERERWVLWVPVFIGAGVALYFGLPFEPPFWLGATGLVVAVAARVVVRRWSVPTTAATCLTLAFLGFGAAQLRVTLVSAPILAREIGKAAVEGRVCEVGLQPHGYRLYLDDVTIAGLAPAATPQRIRLRVGSGFSPDQVGQRIGVTARLGPISAPVAPGSFDFQRDVFFERIGAVGFAFGAARPLSPQTSESWLQSLPCRLSALRLTIAERIRAVLPGDAGAIGVALITGDQGAISKPTMQQMRDSGLAHLLSISGLHIGLVAGILFVTMRRGLCLIRRVAVRYPIKKWGAIAALAGTVFYVFLAGTPVPAVRALIMTSMFLLAVILDRTAISLPPVAWAAVVVLLVSPEELMGPSFQMSFAAVVALVAAYEASQAQRLRLRSEAGWGGGAALYLAGLAFTSLIATLATGPYSIYHFNRIAFYGTAANMIAVPLTGVWVMPWAVLAVMLMPFGLERVALVPMGWGIDGIIGIAGQVAALPNAVSVVPAMSVAGLAIITLGGLWLCLWQRAWRLAGVPVIVVGLATVLLTRPPDLLISEDGRFFAVVAPDGRLLLSTTKADKFVTDNWLRRSDTDIAETLSIDGADAGGRLACDSLGCIYRSFGRTVALVQQPMALLEDCGVADVVVSLEPVRVPCHPTTAVIDRFDLWRNGVYAIRIGDDGSIEIRSVRELRGERPWVVGPQAE